MDQQEDIATIRAELHRLQSMIEKLLQTCVTYDYGTKVRDTMYNSRQIYLTIRLDDFSPGNLRAALPEIERLYADFEVLRRRESAILTHIGIQNEIRRNIINQR